MQTLHRIAGFSWFAILLVSNIGTALNERKENRFWAIEKAERNTTFVEERFAYLIELFGDAHYQKLQEGYVADHLLTR